MSIRDLLPLEYDDIELPHNFDCDVIVIVKKNEKYPTFRSGIKFVNNKAYLKKQIGYGSHHTECYPTGAGDYDECEEYDNYKEVLAPIFDVTKVTEKEKKMLMKTTPEEAIKFAEKYPEKIMTLGKRDDGSVVMTHAEYYKFKYIEEQEEKLKNLHIEERHSSGNLMPDGIHYVLSERISKRAWDKIKKYFTYTNTKEFNDEVWGNSFIGYEIIPSKLEELEDVLEIPEKLRFKNLKKEKELSDKKFKERMAEKEHFTDYLNEIFSPKKSINIDDYVHDLIANNRQINLEGKEVKYIEKDICGGGQWFVVQDDYIWRVYNNGHDGDDWSMNFISTGGAGAYGYKFEKTPERMEILKKLNKAK